MRSGSIIFLVFLVVSATAWVVGDGALAQQSDIRGWEQGGKYDRLYNPDEMDRIKGEIKDFETIVPLPGMSPGTALVVEDTEGDEVIVHLGPAAFIGENFGLKKGDTVKIRGAWAEIDGKDVFIASKVKMGDYFSLKVRLTKDGTPFWTLSPEALEKERQSQ